MNIWRRFLVIGSLYRSGGVLLGSYIGGSGDHARTPVHAQINLPGMAGNGLARVRFWLHQAGALVMVGRPE